MYSNLIIKYVGHVIYDFIQANLAWRLNKELK